MKMLPMAVFVAAATVWAIPIASGAPALELDEATLTESPPTDITSWTFCDRTIQSEYARGCFRQKGDRFAIFDRKSDGRRVAVHWRLENGTRHGLCWTKAGHSETIFGDIDGGGWCNKDFPEGVRVLFRVGTCDGDVSPCNTVAAYGQWSAYVGIDA